MNTNTTPAASPVDLIDQQWAADLASGRPDGARPYQPASGVINHDEAIDSDALMILAITPCGRCGIPLGCGRPYETWLFPQIVSRVDNVTHKRSEAVYYHQSCARRQAGEPWRDIDSDDCDGR